MESLDVGSRERIQVLKEGPAKAPQFINDWAFTEKVFDSLQLLLIATYPAIVRLGSVADPRQQLKHAVLRDKTDNQA